MRKIVLVLSMSVIVLTLEAQKMKDILAIYENVINIEKPAFTDFHSDRKLLTEIKQRTSKAADAPYPQMQVLVDSMSYQVDIIQKFRRRVDSDKVAIEKNLNPKGKIVKNSESAETAKKLKSDYNQNLKNLEKSAAKVAQFHQQFENLQMLHKISITNFADYNEVYIKDMHAYEDRMVAQGGVIGKLNASLTANRSQMLPEQIEQMELSIEELEQIHKLTDAKIVQVRNFQDRIQANDDDEIIYFGPGIALPYQLQMLNTELDSLKSLFESFDILSADLQK